MRTLILSGELVPKVLARSTDAWKTSFKGHKMACLAPPKPPGPRPLLATPRPHEFHTQVSAFTLISRVDSHLNYRCRTLISISPPPRYPRSAPSQFFPLPALPDMDTLGPGLMPVECRLNRSDSRFQWMQMQKSCSNASLCTA